MKSPSKIITATAPGKLILSGEHAVVHGCPGIAVAVSQSVTCEIQSHAEKSIQVELILDKRQSQQTLNFSEAENVYLECQKNYQAYLL